MQVTIQGAVIGLFGVFLGAILGFFSNAYIAKKNLKKEISLKIAEYRLQWINNLNDEFSKFSAACTTFLTVDDDSSEQKEAFRDQHQTFTKICLLMNHGDDDYEILIDAMNKMIRISSRKDRSISSQKHIEMMHSNRSDFTIIANRIVKREWRKTKSHLRADTVEVEALKSSSERGYIYRVVDAANKAADMRGGKSH